MLLNKPFLLISLALTISSFASGVFQPNGDNRTISEVPLIRPKRFFLGGIALGVATAALSVAVSNRNRLNDLSNSHNRLAYKTAQQFGEMNRRLLDSDKLIMAVQRDVHSLKVGQEQTLRAVQQTQGDVRNLQEGLLNTELNIKEMKAETAAARRQLQADMITLQDGLDRTEFSLSEIKSDTSAMKNTLVLVQGAIAQVEGTLTNQMDQLANRIDFRAAINRKATELNKMSILLEDFSRLNVSSPLFEVRLASWRTAMLNEETGAKSVLHHIHDLVMGNAIAATEPLFIIFYKTFARDDKFQSRKWKAEAFADSYFSKQVILYGLWIKALQYNNTANLLHEVDWVRRLCAERLTLQSQKLVQLREISSEGYKPELSSDGGAGSFSVAHSCRRDLSVAPTLCTPSSYVFKSELTQNATSSNCEAPSIVADCGKLATRQPFSYSTSFISVRNPNTQAICGLILYFGSRKPNWLTLKVKVCEKNISNSTASYDRAVDTLTSDETNPQSFSYPYTVQSSVVPLFSGWISKVGLEPSIGGSIRIKLQTDYFPPRIFG